MKLKTLLFAALIFAACGDDTSSGPAPENTPGSSVSALLSSSSVFSKLSSSSVVYNVELSSSVEKNAVSGSSEKVNGYSARVTSSANIEAKNNMVID